MMNEYALRREIKKLASLHGTGTELISIYVPPGFLISDEVSKLREEHGQAANIKSKSTRLNVQSALEKLMQYIKLYNEPPKNGIAVFCGNISKEQSKPDIALFSIEPPMPINMNIYRCDSSFMLEPLYAMLNSGESYAMLAMDGREATLALLKGTAIKVEKRMHSLAHAKVRKGGQSANRYERSIQESINDYYKRVADAVNDMYAKHGFRISGLILGGPGPAKENFMRAKHLNYQVKVLGVFDTGYTDETEGMRELMEKSRTLLSQHESAKETEVMERFLNAVAANGPAAFGFDNVMRQLDANNVARLIIAEALELTEARYRCSACGAELTLTGHGAEGRERHECGGSLIVVERHDAVERLLERADAAEISVFFISAESRYGNEFLMGFGGVAAMLKHK